MEQKIKILIYIHAFFGGIGLMTGIGSIIVKKGQKLHRKMGKLFSITMVVSSLLSLLICLMQNHENLLLFLIAIFTIYLVTSGNRVVTFKLKSKVKADLIDKFISGVMLFFSIIMIFIGIYYILKTKPNGFLFAFFGGLGLYMSIKDFIFFQNFSYLKGSWMTKHIGKMVGAFIASITAFVVAGLGIANLIAWIAPSIIGTLYIIYWNRKIDKKTKLKQAIE